MKSKAITQRDLSRAAVCMMLVIGCRNGSPGDDDSIHLRSHSKAEMDAYSAFVNELCGKWASINRANIEVYSKYVERIRVLPKDHVADFPFRVLADSSLDKCWRSASDVVGFIGTDHDIERLLVTLQFMQLGQQTHTTSAEAVSAAMSQSGAHLGLGIAVARLGEAHSISQKIITHLSQCARFEYWLSLDRTPRLKQEWFPSQPLDELRTHLGFNEALQCIEALGTTGGQVAVQHLNSLHTKAKTLPEWQGLIRSGTIPRFDAAVERNTQIRQLGLDEFIRRQGGAL